MLQIADAVGLVEFVDDALVSGLGCREYFVRTTSVTPYHLRFSRRITKYLVLLVQSSRGVGICYVLGTERY